MSNDPVIWSSAVVAVVSIVGWAWSRHRTKARRLDEIGTAWGISRMPAENDNMYLERMHRRVWMLEDRR